MKQYHLACGKYFEIIHRIPIATIMHPNQYFEEAQKLLPSDGNFDISRNKSTSKITKTGPN